MDKKRYRVCHLLYEEYPRDPRVRRYVNALNESGIYCIIICSKKKNDPYLEELNGNLIYRIPVSKKRGSFFVYHSGFTPLEEGSYVTSMSSNGAFCSIQKHRLTCTNFLFFIFYFSPLFSLCITHYRNIPKTYKI